MKLNVDKMPQNILKPDYC